MTIAATRTRDPALTNPVPGPAAGPGLVHCLYEVVDITTIAVATNTVDIGYLPRGAIPIGGYFSAIDLDTGTEALDMDLGIAANSAFGGTDVADPDFFMNGGVFNGDAITDLIPASTANYANLRMICGPFPVTQLSAKTLVQMLTNTAANATGIGKFAVCIFYLLPGKATS